MTCHEVRADAAAGLLTGRPWDDEVAAHVESCAACRSELAELADTVALLALAGPAVVPPPVEPDPALLGRLLAEAAERRRRHRVRTALAVAAAIVLVVAVGAGVGAVLTRGPARTAVTATTGSAHDVATGVSGSVRVVPVAAGAQVAFTATGVPPGTVCTLRVVTRDGVRHPVLTWTADYTSTASVTGTAAVPAGAITRTELVDAHGALLLPVDVT